MADVPDEAPPGVARLGRSLLCAVVLVEADGRRVAQGPPAGPRAADGRAA
ncbi:hypothetical protein ACFWBX_13195 [Streptomyces sp. NPDC059991]